MTEALQNPQSEKPVAPALNDETTAPPVVSRRARRAELVQKKSVAQRALVPALSLGAVALFVGVVALNPVASSEPSQAYAGPSVDELNLNGQQQYVAGAVAPDAVTSQQYDVYVTPTPTPVAATTRSASTVSGPAVSPGTAQAIARDMLAGAGWGDDQWGCLYNLWQRESGWSVSASNGSSGAYGIPQALPGSKMASAGSDWQTSAATQISWGFGYIKGRYGTPCGAWAHSESSGWY